MRNPERIDKIMISFTNIWKAYPDVRFNQLIYSLQREFNDSGGFINELYTSETGWEIRKVESINLFNVEDELFLEFLTEKEKLLKSLEE